MLSIIKSKLTAGIATVHGLRIKQFLSDDDLKALVRDPSLYPR